MKLGVFGVVVAGAALAVMPLASTDELAPFDVAAVRAAEIQSMNVPFGEPPVPLGIGDSAIAAAATASPSGARLDDVNAQFAIAVFGGDEIAAGSASSGPCDDTATPFSADCFPSAGTDTSDYFAIDL